MKHTPFAMLPLLFSPVAHAHPGGHHGTLFDAIVHLLTAPDHLAMAAIAVLVGVVGARLHRRHSQGRAQDQRR
jgi:hypothetical protein